ncbi:hypothetical protein bAD24_III04595 [Burkholderia sp. AD24]|nr:hypothetical protein bAD24_III04595 [Burkholderia sp. AD24]
MRLKFERVAILNHVRERPIVDQVSTLHGSTTLSSDAALADILAKHRQRLHCLA